MITRRQFLQGVFVIFVPQKRITVLEDLSRLNAEIFYERFSLMGLLVPAIRLDNGRILQHLTFEIVDRWRPYRPWMPLGSGVSVETITFTPGRFFVRWKSQGREIPL